MSDFYEDVRVGDVHEFGSHTFTADAIRAFARRYDPQPFHLDEAAAKASLFGGLCASGWHTAAVWMKLMVAHGQRVAAERKARGVDVAKPGPSPGFKELRWLKPVFAGDTISYRSRVTGKRELNSKPQWGMVFSDNEGTNQKGELVFSFKGQVLVERRGGGIEPEGTPTWT
jgi:acyl dehydratase